MADQFRTVNVPTVGNVNFPAEMGDDDVRDAIFRNYPHLAPQDWKMQHPAGAVGPLPGTPKPPSTLDALPDKNQMHDLWKQTWSWDSKTSKDAQDAFSQAQHLGAGGDNPLLVAQETGKDLWHKYAEHSLLPMLIAGATRRHTPEEIEQTLKEKLAPAHYDPGMPTPSPTVERAKAVGRFAVNTGSALTTPENIALMAGMAAVPESAESAGGRLAANFSRGAGALFAGEMGTAGVKGIPDTVKKLWHGRPGEGLESALDTTSNLVLGAVGAHAAFHEAPVRAAETEPTPQAAKPSPATPSGVAPGTVGANTGVAGGGVPKPEAAPKKVWVAAPPKATPEVVKDAIPQAPIAKTKPTSVQQALIDVQLNHPVPEENTGLWKTAAQNPLLAEQFRRTGLTGFSIDPPHQFDLSEQGNISRGTGRIRVNANAIDPEHTIAHELSHDIYNRLQPSEKEAVEGYIEGNPHIEAAHTGGLEERITDHFADVLQGKATVPAPIAHAFFKSDLKAVERTPEVASVPTPLRASVKTWADVQNNHMGYLTEADDLDALVKNGGDRQVVIKDTNGGRHGMPASVAAQLMKNKRFEGNVSSIFLASSSDPKVKPPNFDGYTLNHLPDMVRGIVETRPDLVPQLKAGGVNESRLAELTKQAVPAKALPQAPATPLPLADDVKKKVADLIIRRNAKDLPVIDPKWADDPTKAPQIKAIQQVLNEVTGGEVDPAKVGPKHIKALKKFVEGTPEPKPAVAAPPERVLPLGVKEDLPTQEAKLRPLVNSAIRIRQLQQAAKDRLSVQLALKEDAADRPVPSQHLEAIGRALGIPTDKILYQGDHLTPEQVTQLRDMLKAGKKSVLLPEDHPETAFGTHGVHPLAEINEESLRAAGVPSPKDRFAMLTPKERAEFKRFKDAGIQGADSKQTLDAGLSGGRGITSRGGRDVDTLQAEHDYAQTSLDRRLKQVRQDLGTATEQWAESRRQAVEPSPLAADVSQLSGAARKWLPRDLYSHEHLISKTTDAIETSRFQEPVTRAKKPKAEPTAKSAPSASDTSQDAEARAGIEGAVGAIYDEHGEAAYNKIKDISDAVGAKFKKAENFNQVFYSALSAYKHNLESGMENAHQPILEQLDKMPPEANATFHANPIPSGATKATIPAPKGAASKLSSEAVDTFVSKLEAKQGASLGENTRAFFHDETAKIQDFLKSVPNLTKTTLDGLKDMTQRAWQAYKERPGNTELDNALGWRRWELSVNALVMQKFTDQIRRLHPAKDRREAMINYLNAGGGVDPEHIVQADLQLKANSFAPRSDNVRLKQGYLDAMQLSPLEKETIDTYRAYDKDLSAKEEALGLTLHRQENYIRQIWKPDSLVARGMSGVVHSAPFATTGAFEKMRKYESYFEGEMSGLEPYRKDFGYLVAARARAGAEVLANRSLIDRLYSMKMDNGDAVARVAGVGYGDPELNPSTGAKKGAILIKGSARTKDAITSDTNTPYVMINHPAFQNWKWVKTIDRGLGDDGQPMAPVDALYKGNMLLHPDVAPQLKRILEPSQVRATGFGRTVLKMSNIGKQTLLIGLFHPIQLGIHFLEHAAEGGTSAHTLNALNPFSKSVLDLDDFVQQQLVVHGLKVADYNGESIWDEGLMSHGFANSMPYIGSGLRAVHDAMFQKYIPNLKMAMALDALKRNNNRYLAKYQDMELANQKALGYQNFAEASQKASSRIYRMTSDQMNSAFGGLNWDKIPVNKTWQDFLRLTVLAPDFLLARAQFVADAFRPGGRESAKALLIGAFVQYTAARAFNSSMNDGDAKWNPKDWNKFIHGHEEYNLRTVQGDVTDAAFDWRRFTSHRLNPIFARPVLEGITQRDVYGHPTTAGQQLFDFAQNVVPMPLQGLYQAAESQAGQSFGWNTRRTRDADDHIADTIIQSMTGLQRRQYRTPAERFVFEKFDNTQGQPTDDDLALEQKRTFNDIRDQFRKGQLNPDKIQEGLLSGKLKPSEMQYLGKTAKETQLKTRARFLPVNQVLQAWKLGTPMEKFQLLPIALHKLKDLGPEDRDKAVRGLTDWLQKQPFDQQQKMLQGSQDELQWEQERAKH